MNNILVMLFIYLMNNIKEKIRGGASPWRLASSSGSLSGRRQVAHLRRVLDATSSREPAWCVYLRAADNSRASGVVRRHPRTMRREPASLGPVHCPLATPTMRVQQSRGDGCTPSALRFPPPPPPKMRGKSSISRQALTATPPLHTPLLDRQEAGKLYSF